MVALLNTRVLIVGAGPTGLMAANQLMRFGTEFILVDKKAGPTRESRAIVVTARSLEIYQQMGLDRQAVEGGKTVKSFNLYTNGKRKAEVKIGEIGKGLSEFSYMLTFEQSQNEELLEHNLTSNGKVIHWNHEFVRLTEHTKGIQAVVQNGLEELTINAEYLIACDGANSQVRQQLNFSFRGGTYKYKFFVVDTRLQWALGYDKFIITPGNENFCAFLPLKKDQTYRIIGTLPKEYGNREDITFRDIENVVMRTIGVNITFETVNWFSVYKLHHRGVEQFSTGRVFLAGDSAHIHSPAGGQGMNTGLQDAYNLCWKLAFVLRGQAHPSLLNTYNEERLPFAKFLLKFTDRGFNMMTSDHWLIRSFRKYVALRLADKVLIFGFFRQLIFKTISQIGYSYRGKSLSSSVSRQRLRFKAGERLPYFHSESIYFLFKQPTFHILHIHSASLNIGQQETLKKAFPFDVTIVENLPDRWKRLGVTNELFLLVRPDNYIAFIFDTLDAGSIRKYTSKYFSSDQP